MQLNSSHGKFSLPPSGWKWGLGALLEKPLAGAPALNPGQGLAFQEHPGGCLRACRAPPAVCPSVRMGQLPLLLWATFPEGSLLALCPLACLPLPVAAAGCVVATAAVPTAEPSLLTVRSDLCRGDWRTKGTRLRGSSARDGSRGGLGLLAITSCRPSLHLARSERTDKQPLGCPPLSQGRRSL